MEIPDRGIVCWVGSGCEIEYWGNSSGLFRSIITVSDHFLVTIMGPNSLISLVQVYLVLYTI